MKVFRFFLTSLLAVTMAGTAFAADWPQFQGPDRNGHSPETGLARSWKEEGPQVVWSVSVGKGYAGPAVHDGEVFLLDRVDEARDILRCFGLEEGEERWRYAYDAPGSTGHSGSRTTPTVDADHVYTVGLMGHFTCVDRKTHEPVWQKNLLEDYGVKSPSWGLAQAPMIHESLVLVAPQAEDAAVAAYDRKTGEIVWKSPGLGRVGYSTPLVTTLCGQKQVVMVTAPKGSKTDPSIVAGLSIEDGSLLWAYDDGWSCKIPIPYPTPVSGDRLFVTGGYKAGSVMLQVTRENGIFSVEEVFKLDMETCGSQIHQPLLIEDHLYINSNSNESEDGMLCLTLAGETRWRTDAVEGAPKFERGSLLMADGMIVALDGKRGKLYLVDPSPEGYRQLAEALVIEGERMWAPMALSDGRLLLRNQREMKCLDLRTGSAG